MQCGVRGCIAASPETANDIKFSQQVKNTGNIPAEHTVTKQRVFMDDEKIPSTDGDDHPSRIMPGATFEYPHEVGMIDYPDLVSGKKKLYVEFTISYEWPGGFETRCYESRYSPELQKLQDFGECVSWTHTPGEINPKKSSH
jgi:hypothetical protein